MKFTYRISRPKTDFAKIKINQDEMIGILDFNENTRDILYNLMG